jgi:Zn-dependent peptidase ImmA (M78 family)
LDSLDQFLEFHVEKLVAGQGVPVDLLAVCEQVGVIVEEREMIPEAAMQVAAGSFRICIQSNFADFPGAALRRRFSLAHELGHILFYEQQAGALRPRRDAPRGDGLEAACHQAASMILVPSKTLKVELRRRPPSGSEDVVEFANRFQVSTEVMLRRLSAFGIFEHGWAAVLTRRSGDTFVIEYAAYPLWLQQAHLGPPGRGMPFNRWFRGIEQSEGIFVKDTKEGKLKASLKQLSGSSATLELRMQ